MAHADSLVPPSYRGNIKFPHKNEEVIVIDEPSQSLVQTELQ